MTDQYLAHKERVEVMLGSAKVVGKLDNDVIAWQRWLSLLYSFFSLMAYLQTSWEGWIRYHQPLVSWWFGDLSNTH